VGPGYTFVDSVYRTAIPPTTLTATPNPYTLTNTTINNGQISIANTVISGGSAGTTAYTGNWLWVPPASSNIVAGNTIIAALPTTNNALTLTINAVSSNSLKMTFNGITYYANAIGTNTVYGTWTFNAFAGDANGDYSPSPALTNTISINPSPPQFGFNSIGSTSYPTNTFGITDAASSNWGTNYLTLERYALAFAGTIQSISYDRYSASGTINTKVSIYSDSSATPNALLIGPVADATTANGWHTVAVTPTYLLAGNYWIGLNSDGYGYGYVTGGSAQTEEYKVFTYGTTFPNPAGGGFTAASDHDSFYATYVQIEGYAKCTKVTGAAGTADSVSFYAHNAGNFRLAIYSDSSGPSSKLWESGSTAVSGAPSWQTVSISAGTPTSLTTSAVTYWLCWQVDTANSLPSYTSGSANTGSYISQAYGSFPSTWTGGTLTSEDWSEYVIYH